MLSQDVLIFLAAQELTYKKVRGQINETESLMKKQLKIQSLYQLINKELSEEHDKASVEQEEFQKQLKDIEGSFFNCGRVCQQAQFIESLIDKLVNSLSTIYSEINYKYESKIFQKKILTEYQRKNKEMEEMKESDLQSYMKSIRKRIKYMNQLEKENQSLQKEILSYEDAKPLPELDKTVILKSNLEVDLTLGKLEVLSFQKIADNLVQMLSDFEVTQKSFQTKIVNEIEILFENFITKSTVEKKEGLQIMMNQAKSINNSNETFVLSVFHLNEDIVTNLAQIFKDIQRSLLQMTSIRKRMENYFKAKNFFMLKKFHLFRLGFIMRNEVITEEEEVEIDRKSNIQEDSGLEFPGNIFTSSSYKVKQEFPSLKFSYKKKDQSEERGLIPRKSDRVEKEKRILKDKSQKKKEKKKKC